MERGLIGDFFCGAGGASVGIENAFGRSVDFAINHDATAIMLHSRNHPATYHMKEDIFTADIEEYVSGRKVSLIWASPDCTHFSKAKGNTPLRPLHIRKWRGRGRLLTKLRYSHSWLCRFLFFGTLLLSAFLKHFF